MKKLILSLMSAAFACASFAANCVSAIQLSTDYATQTVTFKLTWTNCNAATNHLNKVWCFVDFRTSAANGTKGAWTRATISGTPNVVNGTYAAGNATGFYVTGTNGQSATVTVKLGNAAAMFDWCAFATDYPPNATLSGGIYTLRGTKPFVLTTAAGATVSVNTNTYSANCLTRITDATGAPATNIVKPALNAGNVAGNRAININTAAAVIAQTPATGGFGSISYQWLLNGNPINGATNAAYTPPANVLTTQLNGNIYTRRATDACGSTATAGNYVLCVVPSDAYPTCLSPVWVSNAVWVNFWYPNNNPNAMCSSLGTGWHVASNQTEQNYGDAPLSGSVSCVWMPCCWSNGCGGQRGTYSLRCVKGK